MTPVTIPTATRPISLPDLDGLPPHLQAKLRNLINLIELEGTK
jgi:hypothetical protein